MKADFGLFFANHILKRFFIDPSDNILVCRETLIKTILYDLRSSAIFDNSKLFVFFFILPFIFKKLN